MGAGSRGAGSGVEEVSSIEASSEAWLATKLNVSGDKKQPTS
jgi:hypothetical protein